MTTKNPAVWPDFWHLLHSWIDRTAAVASVLTGGIVRIDDVGTAWVGFSISTTTRDVEVFLDVIVVGIFILNGKSEVGDWEISIDQLDASFDATEQIIGAAGRVDNWLDVRKVDRIAFGDWNIGTTTT